MDFEDLLLLAFVSAPTGYVLKPTCFESYLLLDSISTFVALFGKHRRRCHHALQLVVTLGSAKSTWNYVIFT